MDGNIFQRVRDTVTVPMAVEYCGIDVPRTGMISCPFHEDRHPSLKLNRSYYYCFGCGKHGDATDFVAGYMNISQIDAARMLADRFGLSDRLNGQNSKSLVVMPKMQHNSEADFRQRRSGVINAVSKYIGTLQKLIMKFESVSPEHDFSDRFCVLIRLKEMFDIIMDQLCGFEMDITENDQIAVMNEFSRHTKIRLQYHMYMAAGADPVLTETLETDVEYCVFIGGTVYGIE